MRPRVPHVDHVPARGARRVRRVPRRSTIVHALALALALGGCDRSVDRNDLTGVYVLHPDRIGADTLRLSPGGRYERSYAPPRGEPATAVGRWDVRRQGALWALALTPPESVSGSGRMPSLPPYIRPLRSWRPGHALRLPVDDATGAAYERIGP